ncbi:hypothetical protein HYS92_02525 [Candidatus Daviesbacteria bacterium]|nr:hypothetical protein [Candidatus Daviesbacteria bacterium]
MGRETKNFKQSRKSNFASSQASNYAKANRSEGWGKVLNIFKKGGKDYGKS